MEGDGCVLCFNTAMFHSFHSNYTKEITAEVFRESA